MKQVTQNSFNDGLKMDLNPLTTPKTVLTDCLNGTIITYNGNEFTLQNDMGNCKVDTARLSPGFIPMGMKEYGGIIYVASYNPLTEECEVGSFPSPQRDFSTTDFDELSPVNFKTSEFVLETNTTHESTTRYVGKLFEPELFALHPGDMYVVVYDINTPASGAGPAITDQTTMNNYISGDSAHRKLFKLNFYKISTNNSLAAIPDGTIKYIKNVQDLSNEYVYFPEPANAVVAVALETEQLDTFAASVVDSSLRTSANKKVAIQAIGQSASLQDFQGIKVDVTLPTAKTFYLDKGSNNTKKVSGVLDGLSSNDHFECAITPYSKYCLFPSLKQNFKLTIGQYFSSGSGVNDIFQYYIDPAYVKIDFDFKFQGNDPNGLHLYMELYDPWSDYSIVKTVDNPTYYGLNSVILELVNEPRVDVYDSTTVGGTLPSKLSINTDTVYEKSILNSTNLIRPDQALRKNHFYIVRISGIDKNTVAGVTTYQHYDFYKGLFTNDMFNSVYVGQSALQPTDPNYVSDFNALDFDLSKIGYSTTVSTPLVNTLPAVSEDYPNAPGTDAQGNPITVYPYMTENQYYVISSAQKSAFTYQNKQTFETDAVYDVTLTLTGTDAIFGNFDTTLLGSTFPTLIASDSGASGIKPTIVEQVVPGTPATESRATWTANQINPLDYQVTLTATTSRSVKAAATTNDLRNGTSYQELPIINSFHYFPNGDGPLDNPYAALEISRDPSYLKFIDNNGNLVTQTFPKDEPSTSESIYNAFAALPRQYSGIWGCCYNRDVFWRWDDAPGDYSCTSGCTETFHRNHILFLRNPNSGQITACRTHDIKIAESFFKTLRVAENLKIPLYVTYPNTNVIQSNRQLTTTFQYTGANLTTTFTPHQVSSVYVKTYLSNFRMHATGNMSLFSPTVINNWIAARQGASIIVDAKQTIRDGYIPYISTPKTTTSPLVFADITINQSASPDAVNKFQTAKTVAGQDPAFTVGGNYKPHGTVFSSDPTGLFQNYAVKFASNTTAGQVIDQSKLHIYLRDGGEPWWPGYHAANGNQHKCHAPNLFQDFQIS